MRKFSTISSKITHHPHPLLNSRYRKENRRDPRRQRTSNHWFEAGPVQVILDPFESTWDFEFEFPDAARGRRFAAASGYDAGFRVNSDVGPTSPGSPSIFFILHRLACSGILQSTVKEDNIPRPVVDGRLN
jgi:hypothetical protein